MSGCNKHTKGLSIALAIPAVSLFRSQFPILSFSHPHHHPPPSSFLDAPISPGENERPPFRGEVVQGGDLNGKFRYRAFPLSPLLRSSASTIPPRVLRHSLYTYAREFIPGEPVISARAKARPRDILGISEPSFAAVTPGRFEGNLSFMASGHRWRT